MWIISEAIRQNSKFRMSVDDVMKLRGNGGAKGELGVGRKKEGEMI